MHFGHNYREVTALNDGTPVLLRLLTAADREAMREGFARLSSHSRYLRFFTAKPRLTESELSYLTGGDGVDHLALAAGEVHAAEEPDHGWGVARFIRAESGADRAEAAVVVVDDMHGKGLGTLLLRRLSAAARERGIQWFECDFLSENHGIEDLLRNLHPGLKVRHVEGSVMRATVHVPDVAPDLPLTKGIPEAAHRFLSRAASGEFDVRSALKRDAE